MVLNRATLSLHATIIVGNTTAGVEAQPEVQEISTASLIQTTKKYGRTLMPRLAWKCYASGQYNHHFVKHASYLLTGRTKLAVQWSTHLTRKSLEW